MWGRVGRAAASVGLVASALAHLLSFVPLGARVPDTLVVVLFAGALALLVLMLARLRRAAPAHAWRRVEVYDWRELARRVPGPVRGIVAAHIGKFQDSPVDDHIHYDEYWAHLQAAHLIGFALGRRLSGVAIDHLAGGQR